MPIVKIRAGDCIDQIAEKYGFLPETVWEHGKNSRLKGLRKDRNILFPGDELFIPEKETKLIPAATGAKHKFVRKAVPAKFKIQLKKNGDPRVNLAYTLHIDAETFSGKTDGSGWIEQVIPPSAKKGKVILTDVCRVGDNVLDKKTVPIVFVPGVISQKESALWSLHSIPFRTTSNSPYNV